MNDYPSELTQIGAAIAQSFAEKIGQWSDVVPQARLGEMDVPALYQLGDDLLQFEVSWATFVALEDKFQSDFFPTTLDGSIPDTITASETATSTRPHFARRLENFPFVSGALLAFSQTEHHKKSGDYLSNAPAGEPEKSANHANHPRPNELTNKTNTTPSRPAEPTHKEQIRENIQGQRAKPHKGAEASPYLKTVIGEGPHFDFDSAGQQKNAHYAESEQNHSSEVSDATKFDYPAWQKPVEIATLASPDAIWRRPLQNLGDFSAGFQPHTRRENTKVPTIPQLVDGQVAQLPVAPLQSIDKMQETSPRDGSPFLRISEQEAPLMSLVQHPLSPIWEEEAPVPAISTRAINPAFDISTEAENILEALTHRILRDFKRYYPD